MATGGVQVIPVIDLKAGLVVHAVGGQRAAYQPLRNAIFPSAEPRVVARQLADQMHATWVYVADLDAIAGDSPDWNSLQAVADTGLRLILDAGVADPRIARDVASATLAGRMVDAVVVALECVRCANDLPAVLQAIGVDRAVFSLDLFAGQTLVQCSTLSGRPPIEIADLAWQIGFRRLIVLDLAAVGKGQGPQTVDLCRELADRHPWQQLVTGGGVRGVGDLRALADVGCHAALVASCLHRRLDMFRDDRSQR